MGTTSDRSLEAAGGRFIARLYAFAGTSVLLWALLESRWGEVSLLAFVGVCLGGAIVPRFLPWDGHSFLLVRLMVVGAGAVQAAFVPLWLRHPAMLVFPALGTAYAGAVLNQRWVLGQMIPASITLAWLSVADQGLRAGMADTVMYAGLWACVGLVPLWMRNQVNQVHQTLAEAQALEAQRSVEEAARQEAEAERVREELAGRRRMAADLRRSMEEVVGDASGVEHQSSTIAAGVTCLADSLQGVTSTAGEVEQRLGAVAATSAESRETICRLTTAGGEIVGIAEAITALSEQTNLLALNASIESARAGAAGSGFAVVANEVKELARRTAQSAAGIGTVVDRIQAGVDESGRAIEAVADQVASLQDDQRELTEAVVEQSEVVAGIAAAAGLGVEGVGRIMASIERIER